MPSIAIGAAVSEIIIYIAYVSYLIYRPVKSAIMKKRLDPKHTLIKNPAGPAGFILPKFTLIICLPSIFVLLLFQDLTSGGSSTLAFLIYLAIFIFFIGLSLKLLFAAKGDYYLDEYGIRFLRNENSVIYYNDIEESKWFARNFLINEIPITSITKIVAKGGRVAIYNLSERQYNKHFDSKNIFVLKNEKVKTSLFHKLFIVFLGIVAVCAVIVFTLFTSIYSNHGGSAADTVGNQGISYFWTHTDVQHYVVNHGDFTAVSYEVWRNTLVLEIASMILMPLTVFCAVVNFIWYALSGNRTIKKK